MRFGILGPLEVLDDDGGVVSVGGPKPRALLTLLLLEPGHVVPLERLGGESPNALQAQVSRLRKALPGGLVEFVAGGYRIDVDPGDVDAHRFGALAREGRQRLAAGDGRGAAVVLRSALALWRGPALADLAGSAQAVPLEEARLAAVEDLVEAELGLAEGTPVGPLRRLVAEHPFRERLRAQLMRALHAGGRTAEALAVFEEGRRLLAEELGTDPSAELSAVHLRLLRPEPTAPARRRAPAPLTRIIGRGAELERIAALRGARLVTLVGPGGAGKTRLAVEVAGADACFADLSAVVDGKAVPDRRTVSGGEAVAGRSTVAGEEAVAGRSTVAGEEAVAGGKTGEEAVAGGDAVVEGEAVAHAVAAALGLRDGGLAPTAATDPVRSIVTAVGEQELLLVLDNCEQALAACAALARALLAGCPRLTILATSREPLGLTGEALVPVGPLPAEPAVALLAERAAAVRPGFAVGPGNAAAVAGICALVDGLPLAIELAAARLRQLDLDELAARLAQHEHFALLSRGDRTAADRHRTLHAVVDWSWRLLGAGERSAAARFSVFAGGASRPAALAVCGIDEDTLADPIARCWSRATGGTACLKRSCCSAANGSRPGSGTGSSAPTPSISSRSPGRPTRICAAPSSSRGSPPSPPTTRTSWPRCAGPRPPTGRSRCA
ncbi:BTAD domain-containing putative transcriptional regulator [Dactylosporangium sp. CA-052675]|uniref:AfsR/SARP family transcriptional regulator n=1 Tax=Dactylosporangium sp. CA-052675 TaxID=3239927 RepID=UPI003D8A030B